MNLTGKYYYEVYRQDGSLKSRCETKNILVNGGLAHIADWLAGNVFGTDYYPGLVKVDTTGMTVTNANFTSASNVVDGDPETYASASIGTGTGWDICWWKIDLGVAKSIMALYVDFAEDTVNTGADYKFQYSSDNVTYYDFDVRFRPPQDSLVRGKVLFYVNISPPFLPASNIRYIRFNTNSGGTAQGFRFHELKIYTENFLAQTPCVMGIGTSSTAADPADTTLTGSFTKKVSNITKPSANVARFIMDLDGTEANGANYWEVGMFFNASNNYVLQTTSNATTLFSRAIFDSVLSKTTGETAQIVYELTVSNA